MSPKAEKKNNTRSRIISYVINNQNTSKVEISKNLNMSMPTVLSNVNEMIGSGVLVETGEYASTGGRKAKRIGINPGYRYALGIMITANHVGMALVNMGYEIEKQQRVRMKFSPEASYCVELSSLVKKFLADMAEPDKLLGIGISIPGIISREQQLVVKSHALRIENYSLSFLEQAFSCPVYFENDANAAMMAEDIHQYKDAIYLSLNNTLGGAFCIEGKLFAGQNQKAGEFGHMILVPGGRQCYCGKKGCADAYCAASALTGDNYENLDQFMEALFRGEADAAEKWSEYLDHLAILISNLRMAYDMDIILGGEVGGYLADHMLPLGEKVMEYNGFDRDIRYLKNCSYRKEASAVGAAKHFFNELIKNI